MKPVDAGGAGHALITFSFRKKWMQASSANSVNSHNMRTHVRISFISALLLLSSVGTSAQVTLPKVLSSHMVIQRDLPVHVWGNATPGEPVAVSFRGESRGTEADELGHWSVY